MGSCALRPLHGRLCIRLIAWAAVHYACSMGNCALRSLHGQLYTRTKQVPCQKFGSLLALCSELCSGSCAHGGGSCAHRQWELCAWAVGAVRMDGGRCQNGVDRIESRIGQTSRIVLYCIVLYCIVLYCIVLYCFVFPYLVFATPGGYDQSRVARMSTLTNSVCLWLATEVCMFMYL
jgi:hypothetical protein